MIPDWLSELIKNSKPIDQEFYNNLSNKNYTSGDPILIGDNVLYGILLKPIKNNSNGIPNIDVNIVKFKSSEIGSIYELDLRQDPFLKNSNKLPRLKLIEDKTDFNYL